MRARRWERTLVLALAVSVLGADAAVVAARLGDRASSDAARIDQASPGPDSPAHRTATTLSTTSTTVAPATTAPPPATTAPPTTVTPPLDVSAAMTAPGDRAGAWTLGPYQGVGVWLDVYDWTNELTGGKPQVQPADIDRMADLGIQTLYIQTAHRRSWSDVIEPDRLLPFIERAHARGMAVVAWYLPSLENLTTDLRRLVAAAELPVDGLAVDIEARDVPDPAERTHRLLDLSVRLRQALGSRAIAAITPSAVHLQVINPGYWPGFPWPELAGAYDAILPMSYWSVRRGEWRSGERYIGENIDRIRASTGRPDIPIHAIGGIADAVSPDDVGGMVRAIQARGILGASLYDWNTSQPAQWEVLRPLRVG
jgi:hypothetical protein